MANLPAQHGWPCWPQAVHLPPMQLPALQGCAPGQQFLSRPPQARQRDDGLFLPPEQDRLSSEQASLPLLAGQQRCMAQAGQYLCIE